MGEFTCYRRCSSIRHISTYLDSRAARGRIDNRQELEEAFKCFDVKKKYLVHVESGNRLSAHDVWSNYADNPDLWTGVPQNGHRVQKIIDLDFSEAVNRYEVQVPSESVEVCRLIYSVDLWVQIEQVPINKISSYQDASSELLQTVEYEVELSDRRIVLGFHRDEDRERLAVSQRVVARAAQLKRACRRRRAGDGAELMTNRRDLERGIDLLDWEQ